MWSLTKDGTRLAPSLTLTKLGHTCNVKSHTGVLVGVILAKEA